MNHSTGIGPVFIAEQVDDCPREADERVEVYGSGLDRSVYVCTLHAGEIIRAEQAGGRAAIPHPITAAVDRPVCGSTYTYDALNALFAVPPGGAR